MNRFEKVIKHIKIDGWMQTGMGWSNYVTKRQWTGINKLCHFLEREVSVAYFVTFQS